MDKACLSLIVFAAGCGAPPPPPAPTGPQSYAELAPAQVTLVGDVRPSKQLQIAHQGTELPDGDALEAALSRASHVVSVGGTSSELEVALAGAECTITNGARLGNLPDPAIAPELDKHGLDEHEGRSLFESKSVADLRCKTGEDSPAYGGAAAAEIVALALLRVTDGHLYDPHIDRFWPQDAWEKRARRVFSVARNVRVLREQGWIGTRGMEAMGRADLEVFPVSEETAAALEGKLLTIADAIVNDERVGAGTTMELGTTRIVFLDRDVYAATWKSTPGASVKAGGNAVARLAIADPKSRPGDRTAAERLARRLSLE